jgi:hypothetical protein
MRFDDWGNEDDTEKRTLSKWDCDIISLLELIRSPCFDSYYYTCHTPKKEKLEDRLAEWDCCSDKAATTSITP